MSRPSIPRPGMLIPGLRNKLHLDHRKRFLLLLVFFNAMLGAILALSVRNIEIHRSIRIVEEQIRYRIEQLATLQAEQTVIVYITATPTVRAVAQTTATPTRSLPSPTLPPSPTPTSTLRPERTATPTRTRMPISATSTPLPTATVPPALPTETPTWTPSPPPTWTPPPPTPTPSPTPTFPPPPVPTSLQLNASPDELTADGTSTLTVHAWVYDQYGAPVPDGTAVTFATDRGTFWGAPTVIALTSEGVAKAVLTSSTTVGTATVQAWVGAVSDSLHVAFTPGPAHALLLVATPDRLPVGSQATLRATVRDRHGNAVTDGTDVFFETTLGALSSANVTTQGGQATVNLVSNASGTAQVTARAGAAVDTATVEFMPALTIHYAVDRDTAPAGGPLRYTVTVQNASAGGSALVRSLTAQLAAGFAYLPGSTTSAAFPGDPAIAGQQLVWTASPSPYDLLAGETLTASFGVRAQALPGTYSGEAHLEGDNFDPIATGESAWVTLIAPSITSLSPTSGCNGAPVDATIEGAYLAPGAIAHLGSWLLNSTWIDEGRLDVRIPALIAAGAYDLAVTNPGGAADTLPAAYEARNCGSLDTTLDSGYLGTYGIEPAFSPAQGDDDQLQVLFLDVPDTTVGPLYVRVFDPDCGGTLDVQNGWAWDTPFTFTVYGGSGAYTVADARTAHPTSGAVSGQVLVTAIFTEDASTDAAWVTLGPLDVADGEHVDTRRVFKLTVAGGPEPPFPGGNRADLNVYNVAWSTSNTSNEMPEGGRILAFSWTFLIPRATFDTPPRLFAYVDGATTALTQYNWDYDNDAFGSGDAGITMTTPIRTIVIPDASVSSNDELQTSEHPVLDGERHTTWAISSWAEPTGALGDNLVTFWAADQAGTALAIFARSTIYPPP